MDAPCRLDCQTDLSSSIKKLNDRSKLFVIREAPQTVLPKLFKAWKITHLVFERDTDAYAKERDTQVIESAQEAGVEVVSTRHGRTLYDPDELVKANGGKPTMSMRQVQHVRNHAIDHAEDALTPLTASVTRLQKSSATYRNHYLRQNHSQILVISPLTLSKPNPPQNQTSMISSALAKKPPTTPSLARTTTLLSPQCLS